MLVDRIERTTAGVDGVLGAGGVCARWLGHRIHAEVGLTVDPSIPVRGTDAPAERAARAPRSATPKLRDAHVRRTPGDPPGPAPGAGPPPAGQDRPA